MASCFACLLMSPWSLFFFIVFCWTSHPMGPSFLRWALRVAPSSGNLQTTEVHLVLPPMEGLANVPAVQLFWTLVKVRKRAIRGSDLYKGGRTCTRCWFQSHVSICNKPSVDDAIRFRWVCFANREGQSPAIQQWCLMFDGFSAYDLMVSVGGFGFYRCIPQVDKPLPIWFKKDIQ